MSPVGPIVVLNGYDPGTVVYTNTQTWVAAMIAGKGLAWDLITSSQNLEALETIPAALENIVSHDSAEPPRHAFLEALWR